MNLAKIFDLVKCSRNNISCNADILTVEDAKAMSDQFRYAVVNNKSGLPCYLCKTRDDAKESIDDIRRYCCTSASYRIVDLWKNEENAMKICDVVRLCKTYGENTTLAELQKEIQGNKIHKCPKCSGTGKITKKRNKAQYWECCDDYEYYDVECDLCNGQGYTEHMYKPKMIQDGWEQEN